MTRLLWNGAIYAAALGVAIVISVSLTQPGSAPSAAQGPAAAPVTATSFQN